MLPLQLQLHVKASNMEDDGIIIAFLSSSSSLSYPPMPCHHLHYGKAPTKNESTQQQQL